MRPTKAMWVTAIAALALALSGGNELLGQEVDPGFRMADAPEVIYSADPSDSWNQIFYFLFSRKFDALLSSEFAEGAPFRDFEGAPGSLRGVQVSTRVFERTEVGDRAIDPLYPSFFSDVGARVVLNNPVYPELRKALEQAIVEDAQRNPVARALMQNDLWSAYDILYRDKYSRETGEPELAERRDELLRLFGRMIRKLRLTPEEIRPLPENYEAARKQYALPDLFGNDSGWLEVEWFRRRLHDESVDDRRAARIFLKPATRPRNTEKFLNDFRKQHGDPTAKLEAVALVTQILVIDKRGQAEPTGITTEVQVRRFRDARGKVLPRTVIEVYEIRRKKILSEPESGGLVAELEDEPTYASSAGNNYTFVARQSLPREWGLPVVVKLRTRCVNCHGSDDLKNPMTFAMVIPPRRGLGPPVQELDRRAHQAAELVAERKMKSEGWKALQRDLENAGTAARAFNHEGH